jgi:hypothetical protein
MNIKNVCGRFAHSYSALQATGNLKKFAGFALAGMTTLRMLQRSLERTTGGLDYSPLTIKEKG